MLDRCKAVAKRAGLDPSKFDLKTFRSTYASRFLSAHPDTAGLAKRPDASADILSAMTEQAMVDRFAKLAKPPLMALLKLKVRPFAKRHRGM